MLKRNAQLYNGEYMKGFMLILVLILFVCGCKESSGRGDVSESSIKESDSIAVQLALNEENKKLWNSQGINIYQLSYTCTFSSGCGMWISSVIVEEDKAHGLVYDGTFDLLEVTEEELAEYDLYTVIGLFNHVENSLYTGYIVDVTYDSNYGYPVSFDVCKIECDSKKNPVEVILN